MTKGALVISSLAGMMAACSGNVPTPDPDAETDGAGDALLGHAPRPGSSHVLHTEQARAALLNDPAMKTEAGCLGSCSPSVSDVCRTAWASAGFVNTAFASQRVFFTSSFTATSSKDGIDAVVGFSAGPATSFKALAAAIRFNPNGKIDARNGNIYMADINQPYTAGTSYTIELLTDVVGHAYSVVVNGRLLAHSYAFRSQQAQAPALANWAMVSDSAVGSLTVCNFQALPSLDTRYVHDRAAYGASNMAALVDGSLAVANASQTFFLDGTGRPVASMPQGGRPATDAHDNLYLAGQFQGSYDAGGGDCALMSRGGSDVYVSKYDGAHRHLWTRGFGTADDDLLGDLSVNAEGDVLVGVGSRLVRLDPSGTDAWTLPLDGPDVEYTIDPSGGAFLLRNHFPIPQNFAIWRLDAAGHTIWIRTFALTQGGADVRFIRSDPFGNPMLGGGLNGSIDFVSGTLTATAGEEGNQGFVAKLDQGSDYQWGAIGNMNTVLAMEVDNAGRAVISGIRNNPIQFRLNRFTADGANDLAEDGLRLTPGFQTGFDRGIALDTTGSIYWQFDISRVDFGLAYLARIAP